MSEKPLSCVLLADRHHGLTEGMRGLLETAFETVVMVADETSLLDGAERLQPEVAVVDLSLAPERNLEWIRAIRQRCPNLRVIVISIHDAESVRLAALEAGADAFVLKRTIVTDLLPAVDLVRQTRNAGNPGDDPPPENPIKPVQTPAIANGDAKSPARR
jgi:DNA-binding NarL/FixJ family response regulator